MRVLFVHQNIPAQFGHIARTLVRDHGWQCTCLSRNPDGNADGVGLIQYELKGGATAKTHYCTRSFENAVAHCQGVYETCRQHPEFQPDLIVGHSGFGSTLFLRELYDCPIINYFEYYYRPHGSDMDFRPEFPSKDIDVLRSYCRNAMILLDLENCQAGYCPTQWQKSLLPATYADKVRVIFDGIDTELWRLQRDRPRRLGDRVFPEGTRIVSYVARGFESMRGFDIFMRMAKRLCDQRKDVIFLIAGQDRVCYGGDMSVTGGRSFKEWVLAQDDYDLSRFVFLGLVPPPVLAEVFNLADLHVYLTVPFVLSWSLLNAMACGTTVLASNTAPVREVIVDGQNGLLVDFFDIDGMVETANRVLDVPSEYRHLGLAGTELISQRYSMSVCLPQMVRMYEEATV